MAPAPEAGLLTVRHQAAQLRLRAATTRDLLVLWRGVDPTNLRGTIDPFARAAAAVVIHRHGMSAALATRYVQAFRLAAGADQRLGLAMVEPAPPDQFVAADKVRAAGLAGIINARRAGKDPGAAAHNGFVKMSGTASGLVLGAARQVVMNAAHADPEARGWRRIPDPGACDFCLMLAGRGAVYKSEDTGSFQSHDHCGCMAEPVFGD